MTLKPTGIRKQMNQIWQLLRHDEELLRLLYYDRNPLSEDLPDITSLPQKEFEKISMDVVRFEEKSSELTTKGIKRVYITTGRKRQVFGKPYYARQHFFINVIVHEDFVKQLRLEQIGDRINQLLLHNNISGVGNIMYEGGDPYQAPREFQTYLHIYSFLTPNKVRC